MKYAIRLPAKENLERDIEELLVRPPPSEKNPISPSDTSGEHPEGTETVQSLAAKVRANTPVGCQNRTRQRTLILSTSKRSLDKESILAIVRTTAKVTSKLRLTVS